MHPCKRSSCPSSNPGILIPNGQLMSLETHQAMHLGFRDQSHEWKDMTVTPICEEPQRALAIGTVAWEASFTDGRPGRIKSVVGETWVIERCSDDALRWTRYWSKSIDLAPDSASFDPRSNERPSIRIRPIPQREFDEARLFGRTSGTNEARRMRRISASASANIWPSRRATQDRRRREVRPAIASTPSTPGAGTRLLSTHSTDVSKSSSSSP